MAVLEARPLGWFFLNSGYGIYRGSQRIAKVKFGWESGGRVITPSHRYRVQLKGGLLKPTTCLMQGKTTVAEAKSPLIPPAIFLTYGGLTYKVSTLDEVITVDGEVVGSLQPAPGWFDLRMTFTLPDTLPQTHQLLLVWMVLGKLSA